MDKIIYTYLTIFVIIYGLFRLNSNEHFTDNTTIYVKSKYNIPDSELINEKKKQIKQFELAQKQILNAQNNEKLINQQIKELEIESNKKLINQQIKELEIEANEKLIDQQIKELEIEANEKNIINQWNEKYIKNPTSKIYEKFSQIKTKIFEYMTPSITFFNTPNTFFNTAKTCGFIYNLYQPSNNTTTDKSNTLVKSEVIPPLSKGQMYITNNNSQLILHYADKSGITGINIPLVGSRLMITDGISKYQIDISNFNSNLDLTGYFTVNINLSGIPATFFNPNTSYILFECGDNNNNNNNFDIVEMESQLGKSLIVFILLITVAVLVINYESVLGGIKYLYPSKSTNIDSKIEGGKNIFYVGGYDYRDYSD
jgi:hypothetical protein